MQRGRAFGVLLGMGIWRAIFCVLFPPLAVFDRGCGPILLVLALTVVGWVPGVIGAIVINLNAEKSPYA